MKVIISDENGKQIKLKIPFFAITKFMRKKFLKDGVSKETYKESVKVLNKFIKENGHFTFIDVEDDDGENVTIIL